MPHPFDAVLVIAFGGPQGPDDIRPFLANVLRGRRVAPERVEEVAHHYELFGGVSPLPALTHRQAIALAKRLADRGAALPVYVGMRNWDPYLRDTLAQMSRHGVRRAVGFIAAAHRSYSSCTQYRENVAAARAAIRQEGLADVEITFVGDWHTHAGFLDANAAHIRAALDTLPAEVRDDAQIVFTAHSIPKGMADQYPYERQVHESAEGVMLRLTAGSAATAPERTSRIAFQSRSGRPEDPWLGPDICDYLREARNQRVPAVVVSPIGFLCDHVEVLYDLDVEAAQVARESGLPMARANAVNDHRAYIETMTEAVVSVCERYAAGRPLPLLPRVP
ncbi:MAG TPA: ferrochelatase [Vicinamibacterales bacterium]|nr:ferrochelatase [Vicinamibacterales bacterium]